jgi:hypothetical protein
MKAMRLIWRHGLATQALLAEFRRLLDAFAERLAPAPAGRRKVLRDSAVHDLKELCRCVRELNLGALPQFERAADEARAVLDDWQPHELRNLSAARQEVAEGLARVSAKLAGLLGTERGDLL